MRLLILLLILVLNVSNCTTEVNLSTYELSWISNCKTTDINYEVCSECSSGYSLSTDKTTYTAETKKDDDKIGFLNYIVHY